MDYEKRLIYQSNYWYNDGLKRAGIRDLTGAIASLKRSLQYNRVNLAARNLLGLVYYGRGDIMEALVEWILSKNFRPDDNIASEYLDKVQEVPGELENINEAAKHYNQGLAYARQDAVDMAIIQVKKAVDLHPDYVKAQQLLCLLYLENGQVSNARSAILKAHKLDTTDPITLKYMYEINQIRKERSGKTKSKDAGKEQTVTYTMGNETIIQPAQPAGKENTGWHTLLNIGIGVLAGVAAMGFLVMPAILSSRQADLNDETVAFSEKIAEEEAQISALKTELEEYRSTTVESGDAPVTAASTQEAYETLINIREHASEDDMSYSDQTEALLNINQAVLGEWGRETYDQLTESLFPQMCDRYYQEAQESYESGEYSDAISYLNKVIQMDDDYNEGSAYLLLGHCYEQQGDTQAAQENYQKVLDTYPESDQAREAQEALGIRGSVSTGGAGESEDEEED